MIIGSLEYKRKLDESRNEYRFFTRGSGRVNRPFLDPILTRFPSQLEYFGTKVSFQESFKVRQLKYECRTIVSKGGPLGSERAISHPP